MVLGEREILSSSAGSALERSRQLAAWPATSLRITERMAVETAKRIFTETDIARRSVSVNALGVESPFKEWQPAARTLQYPHDWCRPDPRQHRQVLGQAKTALRRARAQPHPRA